MWHRREHRHRVAEGGRVGGQPGGGLTGCGQRPPVSRRGTGSHSCVRADRRPDSAWSAETRERRLEQRSEQPARTLEGELRGVGHLGPGAALPERHGVHRDDGRVLAAKPYPFIRHQLLDDIDQRGLAAEEPRCVPVRRPDASIACTADGGDGAGIPLGRGGEVGQVVECSPDRDVDSDGSLESHVAPDHDSCPQPHGHEPGRLHEQRHLPREDDLGPVMLETVADRLGRLVGVDDERHREGVAVGQLGADEARADRL